jgi:hypothetical protein
VEITSCVLDNFNYDPKLINNGLGHDGVSGACVWSFVGLTDAANAPNATITVLCSR